MIVGASKSQLILEASETADCSHFEHPGWKEKPNMSKADATYWLSLYNVGVNARWPAKRPKIVLTVTFIPVTLMAEEFLRKSCWARSSCHPGILAGIFCIDALWWLPHWRDFTRPITADSTQLIKTHLQSQAGCRVAFSEAPAEVSLHHRKPSPNPAMDKPSFLSMPCLWACTGTCWGNE